MHIRYLKIMFTSLTSLMALFYVTQNMVNLDAAHGALMYVMSATDHTVYTNSFGPYFTNPSIGWLMLAIIITAEYAAGIILAKGVIDMWQNRLADANTFRASMKWAQIGAGVGIFVWFGLFGVMGAAFFQMWQTTIGTGSMNGAFQYFVSCALTLLFLNQQD